MKKNLICDVMVLGSNIGRNAFEGRRPGLGLIGAAFLLSFASILRATPVEDMTLTTVETQTIRTDNGVQGLWSPVQHYRGYTFIAVPDSNLRPTVTEVAPNGTVTTVFLDPNPDYIADTDGHHRFTLGIDKNGYLHVLGDMHGYYPCWGRAYVHRYQYQNTMYWKSNRPLDVTAGFQFCGQLGSTTDIPGLQWGGDSRFFNDRNGDLYYSGRVSAFSSSGAWPDGASEPQIAYAIYKYNTTTGHWTSLGAQVPSSQTYPPTVDYQSVLYWTFTASFEAYQSNPFFDLNNRLYFTNGGHVANASAETQIFGYSDDFGSTWHKASGASIAGLPMSADPSQPNVADIVNTSTAVAGVNMYVDKNGKLALCGVGGLTYMTWNGSAWVPLSAGGGVGNIGPDTMLTLENNGVLERCDVVDGYPLAYNTGYDSVFSSSVIGLATTGTIYGIGGLNAQPTTLHVYHATFTPTSSISLAFAGTASASGNVTGGETAAQAFDESPATKWYQGNAPTGWIQYDLGSGVSKIVRQYEITSGNDVPTRDPSAWTFQGSYDGSTWSTLDTKTGQSFSGRNVTNSYAISNTTAYRYYRLNITANSGASDLQIDDLDLIGEWVPLAPTKIYPVPADSGKAWLSWAPSATATTYNVKRSTTNGGPYTTIATGVTSPIEYCDTTVTNGTTYYYVVSGVNSLGEGSNSPQMTVTPTAYAALAPALQPPTWLTSQVTLTWSPLRQDGVAYNVKRSTATGGPYTTVASNVVTPTYTDTAVANGTTYYYVVSSLNAAGTESPNSNEVNVAPQQWVRIDDGEDDVYGMPITYNPNTIGGGANGYPQTYLETWTQTGPGQAGMFHFVGTAGRFIADTNGYGGDFGIYFDGTYTGAATCHSTGAIAQANLYEADNLSPTNHTIEISTIDQTTYFDSFDYISATGATINNAIGGVATASSANPPSEGAPQAFDGNIGTKWYTGTNAPGWLEYDFGGSVVGGTPVTLAPVITQYNMVTANDMPQRDPMNWQLQGSNDNSTWITLDNETGQIFTARHQTYQYTFFNTAVYRYIRLYVTATAQSGYGLQLGDLELLSPQVSAMTMVDDSSSSVIYSVPGNFIHYTDPRYISGTMTRGSITGNSISWTFTGTGVQWIGDPNAVNGNADVYIDNVFRQTVDGYSSSEVTQVKMFEATGLSSGSHTIKLVVDGTKNVSSSGYNVTVDAFKSFSSTITDDADTTHITYAGGGWSHYSGYPSPPWNAGTLSYGNTTNATISYTFAGSDIKWIGSTNANEGKTDVTIDGVDFGTVDQYSPTQIGGLTLFEKSGLTYGTHTIVLKVTGTKNASAVDYYATLDAFSSY
jgi:hypothetical protein